MTDRFLISLVIIAKDMDIKGNHNLTLPVTCHNMPSFKLHHNKDFCLCIKVVDYPCISILPYLELRQ